jgi:hypothetical protein
MEWLPFQPSPGLGPLPSNDFGNQIRMFTYEMDNPQLAIYAHHFLLRKDFLYDKNHHKFRLNKAS